MQMSETYMTTAPLPDPYQSPAFYSGVASKRLVAWVIDVAIIALITVIAATLPLFIGWFFLPMIFLVVSFIYRTASIASKSATIGMRVMNVELRNHRGEKLDGTEAALHTLGYLVASSFVLPQLISLALMVTNAKGQGLHDMFVGITALNRAGRS